MNILLTSVGRRTYMVNYFKQALNGSGLVHTANSTETHAMKFADKAVITPLIYDEGYIDFLLSYCVDNNINAIISLFDIDLPVLSKNNLRFKNAGVSVVVADYDIVQICNDKWATYKFLKEHEFKTPISFLSIKETIKAIQDNEINYPLIIKPRWGMGSIGIYQADNKKELEILYNKTRNNISESYLKYESQQAVDKSIIIQEKIEGDEYGLDIFNNLNGSLLSVVPKKKLAMRSGETDSAEIVENAKLEHIGEELAKITKHIGNLDVDCFLLNDEFYILELNCRFGGQYPFTHLAGANFPKAIVQMLLGKEVEHTLLEVQVGIVGTKEIVPVIL